MPDETSAKTQTATRLAHFVNVGKDVVALLRDALLFLLAALLLFFPGNVNHILVKAGFREGSLAGFTWQASLVESSNALTEAQSTITSLKAENSKLLKALGEATTKLAEPALGAFVEQLTEQNLAVVRSSSEVQESVRATLKSNAALVKKAQAVGEEDPAPAERADMLVGLQTLGVPDEERTKLNEALQREGYGLDNITWSYPADQRPSWFASRSTVFYYSPSSLTAAQRLADSMKQLTGTDFAVSRGAGLGVDPERRRATFFVHYLHAQ
jgi:hypothetical protein